MEASKRDHICVVIPAYEEGPRIGRTVTDVKAHGFPVLVVDDGSSDNTADAARVAGADVIVHAQNRGKGAALATGFAAASKQACECIITMDGDGQHDPLDLQAFVNCYRDKGASVIVGNRMHNMTAMPFVRRQTNRFMSWLLSREMGQRVPDTQSGFRLYRCDALQGLDLSSDGYAAESEILIALARRGVQILSVPIRVIYGDEISEIHPVRDTIRFFSMLHRCRRREFEIEKATGSS